MAGHSQNKIIKKEKRASWEGSSRSFHQFPLDVKVLIVSGWWWTGNWLPLLLSPLASWRWSTGEEEVAFTCKRLLPSLFSLLSPLCSWCFPQLHPKPEHLNERVLLNTTELSRNGPVSSASTFWEVLMGGCGPQSWLPLRSSDTYVSQLLGDGDPFPTLLLGYSRRGSSVGGLKSKIYNRKFPAGPVVKPPCSQCRRHGFNP